MENRQEKKRIVEDKPISANIGGLYRALQAISLEDFDGCPADLQNWSRSEQKQIKTNQVKTALAGF